MQIPSLYLLYIFQQETVFLRPIYLYDITVFLLRLKSALIVVHHLEYCISADVFGFPAISMPDGFLVPVKNQGDVSTTRMQV